MGEIADMMLEGMMCQWCGEFLDEDDGYPVVCAGCQRQHGVDEFGDPVEPKSGKRPKNIPCEICGKAFSSEYARDQHCRDKHSPKEAA